MIPDLFDNIDPTPQTIIPLETSSSNSTVKQKRGRPKKVISPTPDLINSKSLPSKNEKPIGYDFDWELEYNFELIPIPTYPDKPPKKILAKDIIILEENKESLKTECSLCVSTKNLKKCECGAGPYCEIHLSWHKNSGNCRLNRKGKKKYLDEEEDI